MRLCKALWVLSLLSVCGCAAAFIDVTPTRKAGATVDVSVCGISGASATSTMKRIDNLGEDPNGPGQELTVCIVAKNNGRAPLRFDRTRVELQVQKEKIPVVGDGGDAEFMLPPGETHKYFVSFRYAQLISGEEVKVLFGRSIQHDGAPVAVEPLILRRR